MSSDRQAETLFRLLTVRPPHLDFLQQLRHGNALALRSRANSGLQVHSGASRVFGLTIREKADTAQIFTDPGDATNFLPQQRFRDCTASEQTSCKGHSNELLESLEAEKLRLQQRLLAKGALQGKSGLTFNCGQLSKKIQSTGLCDASNISQEPWPYHASWAHHSVVTPYPLNRLQGSSSTQQVSRGCTAVFKPQARHATRSVKHQHPGADSAAASARILAAAVKICNERQEQSAPLPIPGAAVRPKACRVAQPVVEHRSGGVQLFPNFHPLTDSSLREAASPQTQAGALHSTPQAAGEAATSDPQPPQAVSEAADADVQCNSQPPGESGQAGAVSAAKMSEMIRDASAPAASKEAGRQGSVQAQQEGSRESNQAQMGGAGVAEHKAAEGLPSPRSPSVPWGVSRDSAGAAGSALGPSEALQSPPLRWEQSTESGGLEGQGDPPSPAVLESHEEFNARVLLFSAERAETARGRRWKRQHQLSRNRHGAQGSPKLCVKNKKRALAKRRHSLPLRLQDYELWGWWSKVDSQAAGLLKSDLECEPQLRERQAGSAYPPSGRHHSSCLRKTASPAETLPEWACKGARDRPLVWGRNASRSSTSPARNIATQASPRVGNATPDIQPSNRAHLTTAAERAEPRLVPGTECPVLAEAAPGSSCAAGGCCEVGGGRAGEGTSKQEGGVREGVLEESPAPAKGAEPSSNRVEAARLAENSRWVPQTRLAPTAKATVSSREEDQGSVAVPEGADNHALGLFSPQPAEVPGAAAVVRPWEHGSQPDKEAVAEPPTLEGTLEELEMSRGWPAESPERAAAEEHLPEWMQTYVHVVASFSPASSPGVCPFSPEPSPLPEAFSFSFSRHMTPERGSPLVEERQMIQDVAVLRSKQDGAGLVKRSAHNGTTVVPRRSKRQPVKRKRFDDEDEKPKRTDPRRKPVNDSLTDSEAVGHSTMRRQAALMAPESFNQWLDNIEADSEKEGKDSAIRRGTRRQSDRIRLGNVKPASHSFSDTDSWPRADGEPDPDPSHPRGTTPETTCGGDDAETTLATPDADVRRRAATEPRPESAAVGSSLAEGVFPLGAIPCSEHHGLLLCSPLALRRTKRIPGGNPLDHPPFQRFMAMIRRSSREFEAGGRVLRLKQYMVSDANCVMMEEVIAALRVNSRVQALYIQNFESGMRDRQLELLTDVLKRKKIWALNIGENFNITLDAWQRFTNQLPQTAVSYLYVSEHHLRRTDLKTQMRDAIRENRRKLPPQDSEVMSRITNMWWNPPPPKKLSQKK